MMLVENDCRRENNYTTIDDVFIPINSHKSDNNTTIDIRGGARIDLAESNVPEYMIHIFRYKFTQEFMNILYEFSKIHQYDHRHAFKEAWTLWVEENIDIVNSEIDRLSVLQYDGDILDKMFKSARYYFRKKGTKKTAPKERRVYTGLDQKLLESMDAHISSHINDEQFKPSEAFIHFCSENKDIIKDEIIRMLDINISNDLIQPKIKKTYKNRYFMFVSKNTNLKIES